MSNGLICYAFCVAIIVNSLHSKATSSMSPLSIFNCRLLSCFSYIAESLAALVGDELPVLSSNAVLGEEL